MYDENELKQFDRWGVARPTSDAHGTVEEVRANLKQAKVSKWWMEGNVLCAESDFGPFAQALPTDILCKGTDDEGMPILVKLSL